MEDVGERDLAAVGHVGVPTLSGIAETDRLAVSHHVRQHHHFRKSGFVELIGDVDLQFAEHAPEADELRRLELLSGEAEHAMLAERTQDPLERFVRDRLGKVHALDPCAHCLAGINLHVHAQAWTSVARDGSTRRGRCGSARDRRRRHMGLVRRTAAAVRSRLFVDVRDWAYHGPDRARDGAPPRT